MKEKLEILTMLVIIIIGIICFFKILSTTEFLRKINPFILNKKLNRISKQLDEIELDMIDIKQDQTSLYKKIKKNEKKCIRRNSERTNNLLSELEKQSNEFSEKMQIMFDQLIKTATELNK